MAHRWERHAEGFIVIKATRGRKTTVLHIIYMRCVLSVLQEVEEERRSAFAFNRSGIWVFAHTSHTEEEGLKFPRPRRKEVEGDDYIWFRGSSSAQGWVAYLRMLACRLFSARIPGHGRTDILFLLPLLPLLFCIEDAAAATGRKKLSGFSHGVISSWQLLLGK